MLVRQNQMLSRAWRNFVEHHSIFFYTCWWILKTKLFLTCSPRWIESLLTVQEMRRFMQMLVCWYCAICPLSRWVVLLLLCAGSACRWTRKSSLFLTTIGRSGCSTCPGCDWLDSREATDRSVEGKLIYHPDLFFLALLKSPFFFWVQVKSFGVSSLSECWISARTFVTIVRINL